MFQKCDTRRQQADHRHRQQHEADRNSGDAARSGCRLAAHFAARQPQFGADQHDDIFDQPGQQVTQRPGAWRDSHLVIKIARTRQAANVQVPGCSRVAATSMAMQAPITHRVNRCSVVSRLSIQFFAQISQPTPRGPLPRATQSTSVGIEVSSAGLETGINR